MKSGLILVTLLFLINIHFVNAQKENDPFIDGISSKLIKAYKENNTEYIKTYFMNREDIEYILSINNQKLKKKEGNESMDRIDTLVNVEKARWLLKFEKIINSQENFPISWNKLKIIKSEIGYADLSEIQSIGAKVKLYFTNNGISYYLMYDCLKMPRGWIFGNRMYVKENHGN